MPSVRLGLSHGAVGEIADVYSCAHDLRNYLLTDKSAGVERCCKDYNSGEEAQVPAEVITW